MTKDMLINEFSNWLKEKSAVSMMHLYDFARNEINRLLKTEADGYTLFENDDIFVGSYQYSFAVTAVCSTDNERHVFNFEAIGIGSKENVSGNDYDLADYTEHTYVIK